MPDGLTSHFAPAPTPASMAPPGAARANAFSEDIDAAYDALAEAKYGVEAVDDLFCDFHADLDLSTSQLRDVSAIHFVVKGLEYVVNDVLARLYGLSQEATPTPRNFRSRDIWSPDGPVPRAPATQHPDFRLLALCAQYPALREAFEADTRDSDTSPFWPPYAECIDELTQHCPPKSLEGMAALAHVAVLEGTMPAGGALQDGLASSIGGKWVAIMLHALAALHGQWAPQGEHGGHAA